MKRRLQLHTVMLKYEHVLPRCFVVSSRSFRSGPLTTALCSHVQKYKYTDTHLHVKDRLHQPTIVADAMLNRVTGLWLERPKPLIYPKMECTTGALRSINHLHPICPQSFPNPDA